MHFSSAHYFLVRNVACHLKSYFAGLYFSFFLVTQYFYRLWQQVMQLNSYASPRERVATRIYLCSLMIVITLVGTQRQHWSLQWSIDRIESTPSPEKFSQTHENYANTLSCACSKYNQSSIDIDHVRSILAFLWQISAGLCLISQKKVEGTDPYTPHRTAIFWRELDRLWYWFKLLPSLLVE